MDMDLNDSVQMRLSSLFQTFRVIFYRAIVIIAKVIRDTREARAIAVVVSVYTKGRSRGGGGKHSGLDCS